MNLEKLGFKAFLLLKYYQFKDVQSVSELQINVKDSGIVNNILLCIMQGVCIRI